MEVTNMMVWNWKSVHICYQEPKQKTIRHSYIF